MRNASLAYLHPAPADLILAFKTTSLGRRDYEQVDLRSFIHIYLHFIAGAVSDKSPYSAFYRQSLPVFNYQVNITTGSTLKHIMIAFYFAVFNM
jgi:hypothetical protein